MADLNFKNKVNFFIKKLEKEGYQFKKNNNGVNYSVDYRDEPSIMYEVKKDSKKFKMNITQLPDGDNTYNIKIELDAEFFNSFEEDFKKIVTLNNESRHAPLRDGFNFSAIAQIDDKLYKKFYNKKARRVKNIVNDNIDNNFDIDADSNEYIKNHSDDNNFDSNVENERNNNMNNDNPEFYFDFGLNVDNNSEKKKGLICGLILTLMKVLSLEGVMKKVKMILLEG